MPAYRWALQPCKSSRRNLPTTSWIDLGYSYLFLAIYSLGIDVAGVVFYGELFPNHLRGKGLALSVATIALTDLVYLQATATAFAHIGWKFYLVCPASHLSFRPTAYSAADLNCVGFHHHLRARLRIRLLLCPRD
jgi:hypothetical protein